MKPFEAPQRSVKIKFNFIFILMQLSEMHGRGKVSTFYFNKTKTKLNYFKQSFPVEPSFQVPFQKRHWKY